MSTTETTTDRLSEIKARAEKATPGPWEPLTETCDCGGEYGCGHGSWIRGFKLPEAHNKHYVADPQYFDYDYSDIAEFSEADQALLLRAHDDVPWLVAEVERLRTELEQARPGSGSDHSEPLVPMSEHVDVVMAQGYELVGKQFEAETARGELEKVRAEIERLATEIDARKVHDEATTHHLNVALWLHAEAIAENADLRGELKVAEDEPNSAGAVPAIEMEADY